MRLKSNERAVNDHKEPKDYEVERKRWNYSICRERAPSGKAAYLFPGTSVRCDESFATLDFFYGTFNKKLPKFTS